MGNELKPPLDWDSIREKAFTHSLLPLEDQLKIAMADRDTRNELLENARIKRMEMLEDEMKVELLRVLGPSTGEAN